MADPFIGEIRLFPFNYAPYGWAFCNGQALPINQNSALYAVIGIIYGGDGVNNFMLPNLQGRIAMNQGRGPGLTPRNINDQVGTTTVTLTANQLYQHTHTLIAQNSDANSVVPGENYLAKSNVESPRGRTACSTYAPPAVMTPMASSALGSIGSGQAHENMQPYLPLNMCIALDGFFPVRT